MTEKNKSTKSVKVSKITLSQYNTLVESGTTVSFEITTPKTSLYGRKTGVRPVMTEATIVAPVVTIKKLHACTFPHVRKS